MRRIQAHLVVLPHAPRRHCLEAAQDTCLGTSISQCEREQHSLVCLIKDIPAAFALRLRSCVLLLGEESGISSREELLVCREVSSQAAMHGVREVWG
jgi:hypothetical protein